MNMVYLQGSPWEKRISFFLNSRKVLTIPDELRKASVSKGVGFLFWAFLPFVRMLEFNGRMLCPRDHTYGADLCRKINAWMGLILQCSRPLYSFGQSV